MSPVLEVPIKRVAALRKPATSTRGTPSLPNARNTSAVYGCSHAALPKRDWNASVH